MEQNDEVVERQKLVDVETEEDVTISAPKSVQTPASPVAVVPKISIKSISSGDTTRSRNSASCSIERTITSDKVGQTSAKVTYVNERRQRPHLHGTADERFEFKSRPRKLLKGLISSLNTSSLSSDKFDQRPIKHHSFVSEVPDVKHMERALLGLLDDFHSGKLKAFGSGCTMEQMTKIREQQESLAKLHFELAAAEEDALENGNDFNAAKAQENMLQLMQRLEQLSISIEQLQTSHTGL
uniref:Coiled-coil domain-containing protein 28B n=1 Tax=Glossina austeni TaxID=7395 RepID=A0A1A9VI40_GLOAU